MGKTKLENFNKALRISNVSEEDSGEYFCLASNKMGSIRHTISVRVKGTSLLLHHLLHFHSQKLRGELGILWRPSAPVCSVCNCSICVS